MVGVDLIHVTGMIGVAMMKRCHSMHHFMQVACVRQTWTGQKGVEAVARVEAEAEVVALTGLTGRRQCVVFIDMSWSRPVRLLGGRHNHHPKMVLGRDHLAMVHHHGEEDRHRIVGHCLMG